MLKKPRRFLTGVVCGVALIYFGQLAINRTPFADWIIAPLLTTDSTPGVAADAIVALGAGVVGECWPNHYGVTRVLLATRLWREGRAPVVLFTGGSKDACPIASAMAGMARQVGLPAESVLVETFARNTWENAERSAPLLRSLGARRVVLVTDRLHMRRASTSFERLGFVVDRASVPIYIGHEDNVSMLRAGIREYVALLYYRVRAWSFRPSPVVVESAGAWPRMNAADSGRNAGPLVVLGASYAQGWSLRDLDGVPVVNRGRPGERSVDLLKRFEQDVVAEQPRAVVIWGFVNDLTQADLRDAEPALAGIRDSYAQMVRQARAAGIEPILATEVSLGEQRSWRETLLGWVASLRGKTSYQDLVNGHVVAMNTWLAEFARQEGIAVLDLHGVLVGPRGRRRPEFTQEDGSHLTEAAYQAITNYGHPVLARHLNLTLQQP